MSIAANALRAHQNISVSGNANVMNGLFMNSIKVSYEHNGSHAPHQNKITFANQSVAFEFFAELLKKFFLSRAEKILQIFHADTAFCSRQAWQRRSVSPSAFTKFDSSPR